MVVGPWLAGSSVRLTDGDRAARPSPLRIGLTGAALAVALQATGSLG